MKQAIRSLWNAKAFSLPAVATLALGIGAATAVFSIVNAILIRPFPYREPERLVRVSSILQKEKGLERGCSLLDIEDWNRRSQRMEHFGAYTNFDSQVLGDGPAAPIRMTQLNQEAFRALGVTPVIGRWFEPGEDRKGGAVNKAILSYDFWQTRYGGDRQVLGRVIPTALGAFEVVGVMPPGFAFPERANFWTPMESWYALRLDVDGEKKRGGRWYQTIARLKPGVSLEQAQAEMNAVAAQLEREYPVENEGVGIRLTPLRDAEVGNVRAYLLLLLGAVGILLLLCCANLANLMLARAVAQRRQLTVRAALGADRWTLAKVMLAESSLLALAGGVLGLLLATAAVRAVPAFLPDSIPFWMRFDLDWAVLTFAIAVTSATAALFGTAPAWAGSRVNLTDALKQGTRGSSVAGRSRPLLVVVQVILCVVLLTGAGLLMRAFLAMQNAHPGFDASQLLLVRLTKFETQGSRPERAMRLATYHTGMQGLLQRLPGVHSVTLGTRVPFATQEERSKSDVQVKGRSADELRFVLPVLGSDVALNYFSAMRIPLKRGRLFDERDSHTSPMVVILNESGAKQLFPDRDPIGQEMHWGTVISAADPWTRVVGVVGDVKNRASDGSAIEVYYPITQWPVGTCTYALRFAGDPGPVMEAARKAIQGADPQTSIVWMKTMEHRIGETLWQQRLWGTMFTCFAILALLLSAVGLYGVLSYNIAQQSREIGIRLALGEMPSRVLATTIGRGLLLVAAGLALGLPLAWALARYWSGAIEGLARTDTTVYLAIPLVMGLAGLAACWSPARRAAAVDPVVILREE